MLGIHPNSPPIARLSPTEKVVFYVPNQIDLKIELSSSNSPQTVRLKFFCESLGCQTQKIKLEDKESCAIGYYTKPKVRKRSKIVSLSSYIDKVSYGLTSNQDLIRFQFVERVLNIWSRMWGISQPNILDHELMQTIEKPFSVLALNTSC